MNVHVAMLPYCFLVLETEWLLMVSSQMWVGSLYQLTAEQVDLLAVISMAGVAAEGMNYEDVRGHMSIL